MKLDLITEQKRKLH